MGTTITSNAGLAVMNGNVGMGAGFAVERDRGILF